MTDYIFLDSPIIKAIDNYAIVIVMTICMCYFPLHLFNKMITE
jgi:hypothetical protein